MKLTVAIALGVCLLLSACKAKAPGSIETQLANELKKTSIGGKDWTNPVPDNDQSVREGAEHFQHHCQICHGLDGQNTGVPFAEKMSPTVADLQSKRVQDYSDGQLKWIIENGIRFTGMPAWKGILEEKEMWHIVRYLRHLPQKGSLGAPAVYKEAEEEHEHAGSEAEPHQHTHTDQHEHAPAKEHKH